MTQDPGRKRLTKNNTDKPDTYFLNNNNLNLFKFENLPDPDWKTFTLFSYEKDHPIFTAELLKLANVIQVFDFWF